MSFELPANLERELERYAQAEHMSPAEAAAKLIQSGLRASNRKASHEVDEADLEILRQNVPFFAFLEGLPDDVIDGIEAASEQIRSERFTPRG